MNKLRTGILGCGSFAHRHVQNLLRLEDQVEIVAFCDHHEHNLERYSQAYPQINVTTFTDHHDMIDQADLDLLVVCLPPYAHSDQVEYAAAHHVHLLVEKPIALTSDQAWKMVAAAEQSGIKTQVGFMFRWGEAVERLKGMLDSGEAGRPGLMSARYFCNSLHAHWWRVREKSGGQLVEQVIHMVDLMRFLMGEPASVISRQANLFHTQVQDYTIEDVSVTTFIFDSGALGVIYATNGAIPGRWINDYHVVTQAVTAEFSNANNAVFHFTSSPEKPPMVIASERDVYMQELLDLVHAIRTGAETHTPLREGAKSLDLALAGTASAGIRREVFLSKGWE
jgi:predicted dehydrogenase